VLRGLRKKERKLELSEYWGEKKRGNQLKGIMIKTKETGGCKWEDGRGEPYAIKGGVKKRTNVK